MIVVLELLEISFYVFKVQSNKKKVTFNLCPNVIYEPPDVSCCLHQSRISDYHSKILDKMRMETLLTPILCPAHRAFVFKKYYLP